MREARIVAGRGADPQSTFTPSFLTAAYSEEDRRFRSDPARFHSSADVEHRRLSLPFLSCFRGVCL